MKRIPELDVLRGLAALSVMLFHLSTCFNETFPSEAQFLPWALPHGYLGVELFFMISGFVMLQTVEQQPRLKNFWISRFARLYPAFWVSVLVAFFISRTFGPHRQPLTSEILGWNLTMLMQVIPNAKPLVQDVYWTLGLELIFYLWISLLYLVPERKLPNQTLVLPALVMVLCNRFYDQVPYSFYLQVFHYVNLNNCLPLFVMGMCFNRLHRKSEMPISQKVWIGFAVAANLAAYFYYHDAIRNTAVVVFCLLFFALIKGWLRFLNLKPLLMLGTISYSLYLMHQNLGYAIIHQFTQHGYSMSMAMITAIGASFAAAYLLCYGLERPANRFIREKMKGTE
jgi:peptidoglycan/LPS O-acetylase OafA/YrhL